MRMSSQNPYKQGSGEGSGLGRGRFWAVMQSEEPQATARWRAGESGTQMALQNGPELGARELGTHTFASACTGCRLPQEGV